MAKGALREKLQRWEESEEDWRSCRAEIAVQQSLLETFVSKLPEDGRITGKDHALAQSWTTAITQAKLRACKIEQSTAIGARELRLLQVIIARELVALLGEDRAAGFLDRVADLLSTEGLALPERVDIIEGQYTEGG